MKTKRIFVALLFVGLSLSFGCSDDPSDSSNQSSEPDAGTTQDVDDGDVTASDADSNQPDVSTDADPDTDTTDAGSTDVEQELDASTPDVDADTQDTGPDDDNEWPCPIGTRTDDDGECVPVPTLRIQATDSLSLGDDESFTDPESLDQVNRNLFVSASSSPTAGSLPRENLGEVDRCRAYGALISIGEVESFDAGPVTLMGLRVESAVYTPNDNSSVYSPPPGIPLGDAYASETSLTVVGAGSDDGLEPVFPPFEQQLQTIPTTSFDHDPVEPDEPMLITWDPHPDADVVRIDVETRTGGMERIVVCETEDKGQYEIPAQMTSHLIDEAEDLKISVYQSQTHRIEPDDSQVLIVISAQNWMRRE